MVIRLTIIAACLCSLLGAKITATGGFLLVGAITNVNPAPIFGNTLQFLNSTDPMATSGCSMGFITYTFSTKLRSHLSPSDDISGL
uniref:Uncharacterized protein n=1 Tax=Babesia bovis TaxID=5865 RepID=S6C8C5_BABBO|nr:hypothetical protein [Babesia bovis]